MNSASARSKRSHDRRPTAPDPKARERAEFWRLERKRQYKLLAPPAVPHRRKEARRWLDELWVRASNGRMCERRPDHRHISVFESSARWHRSLEELSRTDPELRAAVTRVIFEDSVRNLGITMDEWRKRSHRRSRHVSKVRAEMQRAGLI